jgi:choline dehydrogenase-like flavoprotein
VQCLPTNFTHYKKKAMTHFDIIIIGSGPGGFSAAMRALDFHLHVCLIEANTLVVPELCTAPLHRKPCTSFLKTMQWLPGLTEATE